MPWTTKDVDRHKKGLSDKQKETWVKVANSALKRCLGEGRSQGDCEGSAIRQANKVAGNMKEYKAHTMSTSNVLISVNAIDVDGEAVPVAELVAAYTGTFTNVDDFGEEQIVNEEALETDVAKVRELLEQALVALGEKQEEIAEVELAESASGTPLLWPRHKLSQAAPVPRS